ncbi:MAG: D-alanine--D-alanine ligase family protein [Spirochaetota bacterium]
MSAKIRIALLCGGRSVEHEISLLSARNISASLDREKYDVHLIYIDRDGGWNLIEDVATFFSRDPLSGISLKGEKTGSGRSTGSSISGVGVFLLRTNRGVWIVRSDDFRRVCRVDLIFPALHGPFGEDGTIQGLVKIYGLPFVGAGVTGSAICMDKDVSKRLFRGAGIPTPGFLTFERHQKSLINFDAVNAELGLPLFIKPACLGSSVGIRKVRDRGEFERAVDYAFLFDLKIILEEYIEGREIECSVLGNRENPLASIPGEVKPSHEFYSYDAKYLDEKGAELIVPAKLEPSITKRVQELAVKAFLALCCEGMARVDFFLRNNGDVLVNEVNTIPGFTNISMYPRLWEASGIPQNVLLDRLVELALERFRKEMELRTEGK